MVLNTRSALYYGLNILLAPSGSGPLDRKRFVDFQKELGDRQLDIGSAVVEGSAFRFTAPPGESLQIAIATPGPQVIQLLLVSPQPRRDIAFFEEQADLVCQAFRAVWREPIHVLGRDCTIRHVYQCEGGHSFRFLWENRLKQSPEDFVEFGRPVLGGGIRVVLPAVDGKESHVEVKIESLMSDPRMLFVETLFVWPAPLSIEDGLKPKKLLQEVEDFATNEVPRFVRRGL